MTMKIEISIEKNGEGKEMDDEELSPEQIAEMAKKLKRVTEDEFNKFTDYEQSQQR